MPGASFLAVVPALPGCTSDGSTPEEALCNVQDAIVEWIEQARVIGRSIPQSEVYAVA